MPVPTSSYRVVLALRKKIAFEIKLQFLQETINIVLYL